MEIETKIRMVETEAEWQLLRRDMDKAYTVALDIETTPDPWYTDGFELLTVAISIKKGEAYVIPVKHPETVDPGRQLEQLRMFLQRYALNHLWVMQNGAFDHVALRALGINIPVWEDTMVMEYLIDVERPKGLQDLAHRYLGVAKWKDIDYKKPQEEALDVLARLNGRDADVTLRLFNPMMQAMRREGFGTLYAMMMSASRVLCDMEVEGIPIDRGVLEDVIASTEQELETLLDHIKDVAGNENFNPNSFQQLGRLLYGQLGLPCTIWTSTGNPSTNAEALGKIKNLHPVVEQVLRYKKLRKLLTASLRPWMELADDQDFLHPRYKPAFVKTGRLSSEMPNIQQVPRGPVRGVFGGLPRHQIVEVDFSQMELRIVAWISGDEEMLDAFKNNKDLHQITANAFGVDRQTAKALNFGLLYGAGPRKLMWIAQEQYGVTLTEQRATDLRDAWFRMYRGVGLYHESVVMEARMTKGVTTVFGRWRPLPDIMDRDYRAAGHAERQALNTPIQSAASDITLVKLIEVSNDSALSLADIRPVATIHDSILFLVPDGSMHMMDYVQQVMEDPFIFEDMFGVKLGVPLKTDIKHGTHWS